MKFEQAEELSFVITESMRMAKFSYEKYKTDPNPKILILDDNYKYNGKGKIIPGQHDILGFNINYIKSKKDIEKIKKKIITEQHEILGKNNNNIKSKKDKKKKKKIYNIAEKAKKEKIDIYKEIKEKFPNSLKYIRHYRRSFIKNFKEKKGLLFFKV